MKQSILSTALLGLITSVAGSPVQRRQDTPSSTAAAPEATTSDINELLNVTYWCTNWDLLDAESMATLWENGELGVGPWLSNWAEYVTPTGNPNDAWADSMMEVADPTIGNNGLAGCGVIGSECNPNIDCEDWARRNYGSHYWAIQALVGFHKKLNIAHEYLQDTTLENLMSISEIASDFTVPAAYGTQDELYAVLGALFYVMGGIAGFAGLGTGFLASTATARLGVVKGATARAQPWVNSISDAGTKAAVQARIDANLASAQAMADVASRNAGDASKTLGAFGASTYMVGGVFGAVGIGSETAYGTVNEGDLEPILKEIFSNARTYLEQLGRLATGRADPDKGDDYSYLPGQAGRSGIYPNENAIGYFFHDGNMLLGEADPTFNETIEAAFSTMKPRIVDQALVTGKFYVFADENFETEERCNEAIEFGQEEEDSGYYGMQWVDGYCMRLMRETPSAPSCCDSCQNRCRHMPATRDNYSALQDKYGFNTVDYYRAALSCSKDGPEDRKPDLWNLPEDSSTPQCWFGIEARKGVEDCGIYDGSPQTCDIRFSDF